MGHISTKTRVTTGLSAGARVMTLDGPVAVEQLAPGDRIVTRKGPRTLRAVRSTRRDALRVVTIRMSALGCDCPEAEITITSDQEILLRDWRAKALYGSETASVTALRLADGQHIHTSTASDLDMFDLVFDTPQMIYAEGVELAMTRTADVMT